MNADALRAQALGQELDWLQAWITAALEAYFQEAGRAGRDEQKAYAVLLYNNGDALKMRKRVGDNFPGKEMIIKVYEALGNYLQLGVGSGLDAVFAFDIGDFCTRFKLPILQAHSSIKLLQQAGYLELTDEQDNSSRVLFIVHKDELYNYKHTPEQERLIHMLLRSYTGLFTDFASISEETIAKRLGWTTDQLYQQLVGLAKDRIIQFIPRKKTPYLTFVREREATSRVVLTKEAYDDRRERYITQVKSVLDYAQNDLHCRSQILLSYFGEKSAAPCGKCDVCLKNKENNFTPEVFERVSAEIKNYVQAEELSSNALLKKFPSTDEAKVLRVVRFLLDNGTLVENDQLKLSLAR